MDAFYASIEQRDQPELRGRPVIVGGGSARGVVAAASYEARLFGVRSAMPGFQARALCPHGIFLPPNMARYAEVSDRVHAVFLEFTSAIEPLALDEAFLDVTGSVALFGGALALARSLKQRVLEATGLVVSVAMAPSKLVAKIACTFSKPDGLLVVPEHAVGWLLEPLPVRRLWGVGPVLAAELNAIGILTIGDLGRRSPAELRSQIGDRAAQLQRLARGEDPREVESDRRPKSFGEENTFERDTADPALIAATFTAHAEAVARRLRRDGYAGRTVTIKLKLGRRRSGAVSARDLYPVLTRSRTLAVASDDAATLRAAALELWAAAAVSEPVRLLGLSVSNIEPRPYQQLDLFGAGQRPKLGPVLDQIEQRFGRTAIGRAVDLPEKLTPSLRRKRGE
jgi:DNA polymerase-4